MSPRKPAVLRDRGEQDLREYLIATAAALIGQRGSADLSVRVIAREAQVADGVLYNYFEDKEDLLAHALLAHVADVMNGAPQLPPAGSGTVAGNLALFLDRGLEVLGRVTPAFAGLLSQPKVLTRFHAMVGGDGLVLPRMIFTPPGTLATPPGQPLAAPAGLARRLAETILRGIAPASAP